MTGVDPGQGQVCTVSRTEVEFLWREQILEPASFSRFESSFSSKKYHFQNVSTSINNFAKRRYVGEYKIAVEKFNAVSLSIPKKAIDYSVVVYDTLDIMMEELLSEFATKQRFCTFRAQQGPSPIWLL